VLYGIAMMADVDRIAGHSIAWGARRQREPAGTGVVKVTIVTSSGDNLVYAWWTTRTILGIPKKFGG
jgi:hypothetical protein